MSVPGKNQPRGKQTTAPAVGADRADHGDRVRRDAAARETLAQRFQEP
jgi:hypothetical protein